MGVDCAIAERGEMTVECEFVKGTCRNHRIKGNKKVTSTKKWTKKKHGFGWVTQKKVTYSLGCIEKIFFSISYLPRFQKCAIGFG